MAQPASWNVHYTSDSNFVNFGSSNFMLIDGINTRPQMNDVIGIFTIVNKQEKCVGYTIIRDSASFRITIYKKTTTDSLGYTPKLSFRIRWWKSAEYCEVVFQNSGKLDTSEIHVSQVITNLPFIKYPKDIFTNYDQNPTPIISVALTDPIFYASNGLLIDSTKGLIYIQNAKAGTYTINLTSNTCLKSNVLTIIKKDSILAPVTVIPALSKLTYSTLSPGCKTLGSIYFDDQTILGKKPFVFQLSTNYSTDVITNTNGKFDELREGNYQLSVRDSTGKETKYEKLISLIKQGDCTSSVLAPNSKDGLQAIFIPEIGTASILNRDGSVIKKLTIPAEWDGRDANGNEVPMGDYYLFINEQQSKVITVIR